jgi:C4-dicarboxylate-specific signal transduction histidine kinase
MQSRSLSMTGLCADEQLAAQGGVLPDVHSGPQLLARASPACFDARQETSLQRNRMLWRTTEPFLRCYGTALLFVTAALISTLLLQHMFPYPFLFLFFAAVMASAWFGGTGSGLFAVLASTLAVGYFFVPPFDSFAIKATDITYFVAFILCSLAASCVSASKKKSEEALKEARDLLEIRVALRTAELQKSNAELRESVEEQKKAEQALMRTQGELAHLSRVLTMGELTSSIAHEVNQPLTAVVTYGHACLEWLSADPPNVQEARESAERIVQDGSRAGAVLSRIRDLFKKQAPARRAVDMNEVIEELTVLLGAEAMRNGISIRTELTPNLPKVMGDRVQLQQVVLNLAMNGIDAMRGISSRPKELVIHSRKETSTQIRILVEDCGVGLSPDISDKIFNPFFTTKTQGIGMGLSISRSIVEGHEGRLGAVSRPPGGAIFQFTIPTGL